MPNEDHGDSRHITMKDLEAAASASNASVEEVADNIQDMVASASAEDEGSRQAS